MEGDPLGALRPDAGQPAELVDEVLDGALVHGVPLLVREAGSEAGQAETAAATQATGEGAHRLAASSSAARLASRTAATHEVLQRLDVVGVDGGRRDA